MIHGAAPCPDEVKRAMLDWWGPVVIEYYAATEGGGATIFADEWLTKPGSVGKAWPYSVIKILDDDGEEVRDRPDRPGLHADGPVELRLSQERGEDARVARRRPVHRRRHRLPRRGRLPVPVRPQERHDHLGRREHLPGRDRGRAGHAPGRRRRRRVRRPGRRSGARRSRPSSSRPRASSRPTSSPPRSSPSRRRGWPSTSCRRSSSTSTSCRATTTASSTSASCATRAGPAAPRRSSRRYTVRTSLPVTWPVMRCAVRVGSLAQRVGALDDDLQAVRRRRPR